MIHRTRSGRLGNCDLPPSIRYTLGMAKYTYRYCPQCARPLEDRVLFEQVRAACPSCEFIYFEDPKVAVVGFITNQERVLLIQRAVDPEKGKWALPGGYMDAGELPEEALKRELMEEVGLAVEIETLMGTHPLFYADSEAKIQVNVGVVLVYRARPAAAPPESFTCQDDAMDAGWFRPGEEPTDLAFELTKRLLNDCRASRQR